MFCTYIQWVSLGKSPVIQFRQSVMFDSVMPWTAAHQVSLSITNSQSLLKLMSIQLVMPSNHLMLCHALLLLPSIFSSIRVFSNESVLYIRWPKYWHFSFLNTHLPMNTQDWFLLGRTGGISLQSKGLSRVFSNTTVKKKIIQCSAFFILTLTSIHDYWKNHSLD